MNGLALELAIADHLNIDFKLIETVERWAHVLFVRFVQGRPRFVSKKIQPKEKKMTTQANPKMKTKTCIHSGLTFQDDGRLRVHPEVSYYTAHKDPDFRYVAKQVIVQGKTWESLEKLKEAVSKAWDEANASEQSSRCNLVLEGTGKKAFRSHKAWIAKIVGTSAKYGYEREFIEPVSVDGRSFHYNIDEPGIYQSEAWNYKGTNNYRAWYCYKDGELQEITETEAQQVVGLPEEIVSLSYGLPLTDNPEESVEECWECGAKYTKHGYVDNGNMGCRRCNA